jgi:hypothetical protein
MFDMWVKQFDWHLRKRAVISVEEAGIPDDDLEAHFSMGKTPEEAVKDFIEEADLDDRVSDPWLGPGPEYWKKWEKENPFPSTCSTS